MLLNADERLSRFLTGYLVQYSRTPAAGEACPYSCPNPYDTGIKRKKLS